MLDDRCSYEKPALRPAEVQLVAVGELPLAAQALAVHAGEVGRVEVHDHPGLAPPLDPGVPTRDEGLVQANRDVLVAPHLEGLAVERELHFLPVRPLPDEPRDRAHGPARRAARLATAGPSLSMRVASFASAAAR